MIGPDRLEPPARTPAPPRGRKASPAPAAWLILVLAVLASGACSPTYVLRAGWEEAKLLSGRRPIPEVVGDTATSPELRGKLRLVLQARDWAERSLGLEPGDSFTSYARVESDTLLLVVSAAPRFELRWKTWWFPIVGSVPYRGYFDFDEAREEARELREEGWDVYLRPTSAFSTLGWLPDPVLSTVLRQDSVGIVETVLHEITHTTYFPSGHADFNESFATFVGHAGAGAFFCRALEREPLCREARDRWHDTRRWGRFLTALRDTLADLYGRELPAEEAARRKEAALDSAARRFEREVAPGFRTFPAGVLDRERLNNAWLLSRVLYYGRLDDFEAVREREGGVREAVRAIIDAARAAPDPWTGLDRLLAEGSPGGAGPPDGG